MKGSAPTRSTLLGGLAPPAVRALEAVQADDAQASSRQSVTDAGGFAPRQAPVVHE
jgi:hypothetical protein